MGEIIENTNEENVKLWLQISVMKKGLKVLENENNTLRAKLETKMVDAKSMLESSNGVSTNCEEEHKRKLDQLEKEHSEIEEELQQWVEDGDQKIRTLEEIIETTNYENVTLLVQISDMKKESKGLQNENNTLQTELKTKRTDLKSLRVNERELRNLKRDLKRKELSLNNALAEKQELLGDIEYLEGSLKDSQAANEQLNVQIDGLKDVVKELNQRPDYGHLREEVELLKGYLDLFRHKEELLSFQVDALTAETSHFKACELDFNKLRDETSSIIDQLEVQLDICLNENTRIMSEKDKELNELKDAKSKVIDQLEDQLAQSENRNARIVSEKNKERNELKKQNSGSNIQLRDQIATLIQENARVISENVRMMKELGEKSRVIDELEDQLAKLKNENATVTSDKIKEMMELNDQKARVIDKLEEEVAKLMRENSSLETELSKISYNNKKLTELQEQVEKKNLSLSELDMAYHSLSHNDVVIEKLMKDLEREMFEKDVLSTALEFSLDNCAIKEKAHARETRNLEYQLQQMKFLLNIMDSCSDVDGSTNQVCVCREKFFTM